MALPGSAGTVTYQYDPFGRRIEKVSPTGMTIYAYDGDNVVEELDGGGTAVARYAQGLGIDEPLAMYRGGASYYYNADGLGSITSLTNSSGQIAATYTYDSFGKLTASTGTVANPFRYTGREYGSDTGLYYYRARYYDSSVGRFISEDPLAFHGADINLFRYVRNRPVAFTDPLGLLVVDPTFNSDCLPALERALDIVRRIATSNKTCNCAFKGIGSGRPLLDLVNDPNITIHSVPHDKYTKDASGNVTGWQASYVYPYDTLNIFIRPISCRMGRWTLAGDLVHELVHLSKGSVPGDDEQLPEDMEILCGTTKPQMSFTR